MARADKSVTAVTDQQKEEQAEQWRTSGARSATMTNGYDPSRAAMNQRQTSDSDHDSSRVATEQRQSTDGPATHQRRISYPDPSRQTSDRRAEQRQTNRATMDQ